MRNNFRMSMMQYLEYERQSIESRGLEEGILSFSSLSMKMNYSSLRDQHKELSNAFDRSLGWYAGNIRAVWPHNKAGMGTLYELTSAELDQFRRLSPDPTQFETNYMRKSGSESKNDKKSLTPLQVDRFFPQSILMSPRPSRPSRQSIPTIAPRLPLLLKPIWIFLGQLK